MKAKFKITLEVDLPGPEAYPADFSTPDRRVEYEKLAFEEDNGGWLSAIFALASTLRIEGEVIDETGNL